MNKGEEPKKSGGGKIISVDFIGHKNRRDRAAYAAAREEEERLRYNTVFKETMEYLDARKKDLLHEIGGVRFSRERKGVLMIEPGWAVTNEQPHELLRMSELREAPISKVLQPYFASLGVNVESNARRDALRGWLIREVGERQAPRLVEDIIEGVYLQLPKRK